MNRIAAALMTLAIFIFIVYVPFVVYGMHQDGTATPLWYILLGWVIGVWLRIAFFFLTPDSKKKKYSDEDLGRILIAHELGKIQNQQVKEQLEKEFKNKDDKSVH